MTLRLKVSESHDPWQKPSISLCNISVPHPKWHKLLAAPIETLSLFGINIGPSTQVKSGLLMSVGGRLMPVSLSLILSDAKGILASPLRTVGIERPLTDKLTLALFKGRELTYVIGPFTRQMKDYGNEELDGLYLKFTMKS